MALYWYLRKTLEIKSHKDEMYLACWIQPEPIHPLFKNLLREMNHCKCKVSCDLMSCYLKKLRVVSNSGVDKSFEVVICVILCFINSNLLIR